MGKGLLFLKPWTSASVSSLEPSSTISQQKLSHSWCFRLSKRPGSLYARLYVGVNMQISFIVPMIPQRVRLRRCYRRISHIADSAAKRKLDARYRAVETRKAQSAIQVAWMAVPMGWAANYMISFGWYLTGKWKRVKVISADQGEKHKK